jgi:hypothetical protein
MRVTGTSTTSRLFRSEWRSRCLSIGSVLYAVSLGFVIKLNFYRAPSFLLKQDQKVNPNKNPSYYQQQKNNRPKFELVHPNPPTVALLPLRPKTCLPRVRERAAGAAPVITDMLADPLVSSECPGYTFKMDHIYCRWKKSCPKCQL